MADGILCRRCGYQESEHADPSIIDSEGLSKKEFDKKHKKLLKCRLKGTDGNFGYIPEYEYDPDDEDSVLQVKRNSICVSAKFCPGD